jgi:hypothetical protein
MLACIYIIALACYLFTYVYVIFFKCVISYFPLVKLYQLHFLEDIIYAFILKIRAANNVLLLSFLIRIDQ